MTTPRGRTSHVRRRPPSTGRPAKPARGAVRPQTQRVREHRGLEARRRRLPLPTRLLLGLSVVALGLAVFFTATGGIGPIVATLGAGFANAIGRLAVTPVPTDANVVATNSPIIAEPESAYTNEKTIQLRIIIPNDVVNDSDAKIRVYLALQGLEPAPIQDVVIGSSISELVPVELTKGRNDFTATIIRSGIESESSPVVTVFLDQTAPKVTITSPKDATKVINTPDVTVKGKTEAKATLTARNDANAASVTVSAANDGQFQFLLPLEPGANAIHIDATDLAGNTSTTDLTYTQGEGEMTANLSASAYTISISHPPSQLRLTVVVHDPTGAPIEAATAFFTLQIPGLAPISGSATTGADGRATFSTPLVGKMTAGNGQGTVLVTHPVFGRITDRVGLLFVK
jgi:hypothetical protein